MGYIIFTLIFLVGIAAGFIVLSTKGQKKNRFALLALTPIALLPLAFGSFARVGANEVGIIFDEFNGGILQETYDQGIHLKSPFRTVTNISTANRTAQLSTFSQTNAAYYVEYELTLVYRIEKQDAGLFYRSFNAGSVNGEILNSVVKKHTQAVTIGFDIFDILGGELETLRAQLETAVKYDLKTNYHITLISLSINDIDGGSQIEQSLRQKAEAELAIQIAQQNQRRAEIEAETALIKAQNEADILLLQNEAEVKALERINSVAVTAIQTMYNLQFETEAIRVEFEQNQTGGFLTIQEIGQIVVKQLYYDKWDGKLPTVVTDGSGIIIQP